MTPSFRDQDWSTRFASGGMGDQAEGVFEETYPQNWDRFGADRATINLRNVPEQIRFAPDYITAKGLVEVQGFGRDQKFKLKDNKLAALWLWDEIFRTDIFVWDSFNKRYGWLRLHDITAALDDIGTADAFDGGRNPYRWLKADQLPIVDDLWVTFDVPTVRPMPMRLSDTIGSAA